MAGAAFGRDQVRMDVLGEMTSLALRVRGLQHGQILCAGMAVPTLEQLMITHDGETCITVIKIGTVSIQSVVTPQAGRVEVSDVLNDKPGIIRDVAGAAGV